jgi:hypothetical protein
MKLVVFFHRDELYKSAREGQCPFLFGFVKNGKMVAFKDLSTDHWKRSILS